ncbi:uncharacterized protein TRAVEDRAFT_46492 [Trametes versicolor FP-101664 SS1]|uniref:uncharacterized protein n=1 Tax=Trametes versicolor (strain FP-101664) TaxID=717944 RepID=UPI00046218C5|nr:uncharacterized protein TRAVEDRAFT_46492 [Trametes versicolor FP-101664 SS1]EIW59186.1 hypothetical protein TRAVEDRAFT_46492 [Trametes versicolor FP-101664 SS1]
MPGSMGREDETREVTCMSGGFKYNPEFPTNMEGIAQTLVGGRDVKWDGGVRALSEGGLRTRSGSQSQTQAQTQLEL